MAIAVPATALQRGGAEPRDSLMFKRRRGSSLRAVFNFVIGAAAKNRRRGYECAAGLVARLTFESAVGALCDRHERP
jgi:hypothetical protein